MINNYNKYHVLHENQLFGPSRQKVSKNHDLFLSDFTFQRSTLLMRLKQAFGYLLSTSIGRFFPLVIKISLALGEVLIALIISYCNNLSLSPVLSIFW